MARFTLFSTAALSLLALAVGGVAAQECDCAGDTQYVTYIVVDMPPTVPLEAAAEAAPSPIVEAVPLPEPSQGSNTTSTFGPVIAPDLDVDDLVNIVPQANVSLYYGSAGAEEPGSINMTLAMNTPTVVLEYVSAITNVDCSDDGLTVTFNDTASFERAVTEWTGLDDFVLVTNHMGDCDAEFERGFFLATDVAADAPTRTVVVTAAKEELVNIAGMSSSTVEIRAQADIREMAPNGL